MSVLLEAALRASLMAAAVGAVLALLRIASPAPRYWAWVAMTAAMLVLPLFLVWAPGVPVPLLPRGPVPFVMPMFPGPSPDMAAVLLAPATTAGTTAPPAVAASLRLFWPIYLLGLGALLLRTALGACRAWLIRRAAVKIAGRWTHPTCVAPITVGLMRPRVLLPPDWPRWHATELGAVLAHEDEHVRRRDPLLALITLANRAVFWFHPLAWWLHRHVSRLAEESCDATVLARGHDPGLYARALLRFARRVARAQGWLPPLAAGMASASALAVRLRRIVSAGAGAGPVPRPARGPRVCAVVLCAAALLGPALLVPVHSQSAARFEVTSVRVSKARTPLTSFSRSPGRITATNVPVRELIRIAYGLQPTQVIGGPPWIDTMRVDVTATGAADPSVLPTMMQHLLTDRFALKVRRDTRALPVFELVMDRDDRRAGPQLRASGTDCRTPAPEPVERPTSRRERCEAFIGTVPRMEGEGVTMAQLAGSLSRLIRRTVLDRTSLTGGFDFELQWTPDGLPPRAPGTPADQPIRLNGFDINPDGPSLFSALREQLGLRLSPGTGPVEVIVIDQASMPDPN